ncbi:MAG: VWA domain-containing protein [Gemmatimonadales bacterium]|nr:VWA domain-containing protein [Gemmatimonadales bacterium]MBA3555008.1 VWA domain-containing protein [Gemmatimonadales bacterium]
MDGATFTANAMRFGRLLRRAGLEVEPGQTATFLRALTLLGFDRRGDVRAAGRAIFVRRREDRPLYDAAFDLFWRRRGTGGLDGRLPRLRQEGRPASLAAAPESEGDEALETVPAVRPDAASEREALRTTDFASLTPAEARDAQAMLEALRPRLPVRRARRSRLDRAGHRPAMRTMLRRSLASGGEPMRWRWLRRTVRVRPIVLVCDISGSMERYSRFMLRFAHALQRSGARVEVFVFGTRLTRITRQLRTRSPDEALRRVAGTVVDWSGGTRIGESLKELNRRWVRRTVRSGAVVLVVSDGWERGDPALLAREMATLRRSCHRLLWIDPLAARPGFEPATAGLRAALPHVDELVPAASVATLEELAGRLGSL